MKQKFLLILIAGIVIRLMVAIFTVHPDIGILNFVQSAILRQANINPYSFQSTLDPTDPRVVVFGGETPDDLPLQYWILVPFYAVLQPMMNVTTETQFLVDYSKLFGNLALYWHLLLLKLPLLIFDVGAGLLLLKIIPKENKLKGLAFWMFNPILIWATAAIGQVDIIPTFFVIAALFFYQRNKSNLSILMLGVAAAIKSYAFLLAPFFILAEKNWLSRIKMAGILIIPWVLSVLPYLPSPEFRTNALFAPQLDKVLYAKIYLSGGEAIFVSISILIFLYFLFQTTEKSLKDIIRYSLVALLMILGFTHFHIQWFVWTIPFLTLLYLSKNPTINLAILTLHLATIAMLLLFEGSLSVKLFSPLIPLLDSAQGLGEILTKSSLELSKNMSASLFLGASLFISYFTLKRHQE